MDNRTIGSYVAQDFRTAAIFSKYGIDFCCKGNRSIAQACEKKNLNALEVETEILLLLNQAGDNNIDFNQWDLDLLADYIEKTHHRFVLQKAPVLLEFLNKLCRVHGANHPELFQINEHFTTCVHHLGEHMEKEEMILFPYIREMVSAQQRAVALAQPHFGSIENPIAVMHSEHSEEGARLEKIALLTNNYTAPADACNTFKVTYAMLEEFQEDLHKHIHLENNILFEKALVLERNIRS